MCVAGNCCSLDEDIALTWCLVAANRDHELYGQACDQSHSDYGTSALQVIDGVLSKDVAGEVLMWNSGFCDMLGRAQRDWLKETLSGSTADLTLVISGSVLLSNPTWEGDEGEN